MGIRPYTRSIDGRFVGGNAYIAPYAAAAPWHQPKGTFRAPARGTFAPGGKSTQKRRSNLRFENPLRAYTCRLSCSLLPREHCAMQISPKSCIVSASLFTAALALKCEAAQSYVSTQKYYQTAALGRHSLSINPLYAASSSFTQGELEGAKPASNQIKCRAKPCLARRAWSEATIFVPQGGTKITTLLQSVEKAFGFFDRLK